MFDIVPYKAEHVLPMLDQASNTHLKTMYENGLAKFLESQEKSMTGLWFGKPMVCGGVAQLWEGRGVVWTVFNEESKNHFIPVFRGIRAYLKHQLLFYRRLELSVPVDFDIGHRRARMLGFQLECEKAKAFLPDGTDCSLYVMLRDV
jgi:hypothetical protein